MYKPHLNSMLVTVKGVFRVPFVVVLGPWIQALQRLDEIIANRGFTIGDFITPLVVLRNIFPHFLVDAKSKW